MHSKFRTTLLLLAFLTPLSACAPLVIGGAAAVVADQVAEDNQGGDGLF